MTKIGDFIDLVESCYNATGNENNGFLSKQHGFLPVQQPEQKFPDSHRVWDELIEELPRLVSSLTLHERLQQLPTLGSDKNSLDDRYLLRAASFLGIVSHACATFDVLRPSLRAPEAILVPWTEISKRLCRSNRELTYVDLIMYNWMYSGDSSERTVDNMNLLIPTVGNEEERLFYLAQVELLSIGSGFVRYMIDIESSLESGDQLLLRETLRRIQNDVEKISSHALKKISPSSSSKYYACPIVWTKTVSPLAVPIDEEVHGPSGMASPVFQFLDALVGRESYATSIGQESLALRMNYPANWVGFLNLVRHLDLPARINGDSLNEAVKIGWGELLDSYQGPEGLLFRHRRKVHAYLPIGFLIGKDTTVSGFKPDSSEPQHYRVSTVLEDARRERFTKEKSQTTSSMPPATMAPPRMLESYVTASELARHSGRERKPWFAASNLVYDVSTFLDQHPGGSSILIHVSGTDATKDIGFVGHLGDAEIYQKMTKRCIGRFICDRPSHPELLCIHQETAKLLQAVVKTNNSFDAQKELLERPLTCVDDIAALTPQRLRLLESSNTGLRNSTVPSLLEMIKAVELAVYDCEANSLYSEDSTTQEQIDTKDTWSSHVSEWNFFTSRFPLLSLCIDAAADLHSVVENASMISMDCVDLKSVRAYILHHVEVLRSRTMRLAQ